MSISARSGRSTKRPHSLLSIGKWREVAQIYRTSDGGERWQLLYTNPDPKGFWDALAFWDDVHGIILGDPVDGHFVIMTTENGGQSWRRQKTPAALPSEGAFAASNSCLTVHGAREVWFGTGGPGGARVFHSEDGGATWTVAKTPIRNDGASAGIFSLAFSDTRHGIAVGGDYNKPTEIAGVVALTSDGGKTWTVPNGAPSGFRSDVEYLLERKMWITTGTSGSDYSLDNGNSWKSFDGGNYNAIGLAPGAAAWAGWSEGRDRETQDRVTQRRAGRRVRQRKSRDESRLCRPGGPRHRAARFICSRSRPRRPSRFRAPHPRLTARAAPKLPCRA